MQRRRRSRSIRGRILSAMLLMSLIPLIVITVQSYHCSHEAVMAMTHDHLKSVLSSRTQRLEAWLQERLGEFEMLAGLPTVKQALSQTTGDDADASRSTLDNVLTVFHQRGMGIDAVVVVDAELRPRSEAKRVEHRLDDLTDGGAILMGNDTVRLGKEHLHDDGTLGIHVAAAIRDNGALLGFVLGNLNVSSQLQPVLIDRTGLGSTGRVYLLDTHGEVVASDPDFGPAIGTVIATGDATTMDMGGSAIRHYVDTRGRKVLGVQAPIALLPWTTVAELGESEALAWLRTLLYRALGTTIVTLFAAAMVGLWLSGRLNRPLRQLADVAHRVRQGHLNERVGPVVGLEAEEVREAFNKMLDDLRRNQEELIRTAALASVGELTSSIVHEMRNPLSSIKMNLQTLNAAVRDDTTLNELAVIAREQVVRVEIMLTELLHFGRPVELQKREMSFSEVARRSMDIVHEAAEERRVTIETRDDLHGAPLYCDPEHMGRALSNLLLNAVQASPADSTVWLRADRDDAGIIRVRVEDNGQGLTKEAAERVFQPFFSSKAGGVGLGLANVKKIIELHGGDVRAQNRPERGAVFTLRLPPVIIEA